MQKFSSKSTMSSLHGLLEQNTKAKHIIKNVLKRFYLCQDVGVFFQMAVKKEKTIEHEKR